MFLASLHFFMRWKDKRTNCLDHSSNACVCDNSTIAPTTDKSIFHTPLLQHSQFFLHYIAKNIDLYSRYYMHPVQCLCFPERICFYLFMYLCLVSCLEPLVAEILLLPEYSEYLCICICVFVYLCICIYVFVHLRAWSSLLLKSCCCQAPRRVT